MARKRSTELSAPYHLIEPINPFAAPPAYHNTPGFVARLLEDYRLRDVAHNRTGWDSQRRVRAISTAYNGDGTGQFQAPVSPMDALANTALHTNPAYPPPPQHASRAAASPGPRLPWSPSRKSRALPVENHTDQYGGRPAKRARSEALPSPFTYSTNSRPSTSHDPSFGLRHNVEQGVSNVERKRQLSQAERDILEFMESLKTKRSEGNPDPWLPNNALPAPILEELNAHANADVPQPLDARLGGPSRHVDSQISHTMPDPGVRVMQVRIEQPPYPTNLNDGNSVYPEASLQAAQTHTPPEEKATSFRTTDFEAAPLQEYLPKTKAKQSKAKSAANRRASKTKDKSRERPKLEQPQQLESPQSLLVDYAEGRSVETTSQATETSQSARHSDPGYPPRPRSASGLQALDVPSAQDETRSSSVPPTTHMMIHAKTPDAAPAPRRPGRPRKLQENTVCASCNFSPNSVAGDTESWLQCNGCKKWFHFACAGFKNEREVRSIDKFHCKACTPKFGKTTHVRKSARAHNSVDYAKLTEGIVQTADDTPEHHYIKPIKSGEIEFTPEYFPRMPAELITSEYFQKCHAMTEPIVIPAALNPRPNFPGSEQTGSAPQQFAHAEHEMTDALDDTEPETEHVEDLGQDGIGMVIPQGLTVRRVAELYGPHERLAVIDVKSQEGEDKRWTLSKWADYYEDESEDKPVRNVISLEVSRSRLGRLIRRPQVVRDLDLADSVWPMEDGPPPKVQFYVLMSVADCYTDFHIDFGGSSVYYHILKGKKTFFFIPPTTANLKHYENWCKSQAQNYCWLGNQTKECYRVDLSEGDTMLIPSGWIHAVWTPATSLVIGGNFLTRLHYTNQIRVAEIEKNTKVALKFRYPYFQKVMWFTVLQYLEQDPLPYHVEATLLEGGQFARERPIYQEYNKFGHNSDPGPEFYNARYYPQAELDGLPDLLSYIFRTVMIMLGRVEGVTVEAQTAVTKSIPKNRGNPLENARKFAMWVAWKRGNEQIPEWAHPEAVLPERPEVDDKSKKLSAAALKKLERAKHIEMYHTINADHRSRRANNTSRSGSPGSTNGNGTRVPYASPKNSVLGPKRSACDACRKRRVGCKHKAAVRDASMVNGQRQFEFVAPSAQASSSQEDGFDPMMIDPALEGLSGTPQALASVEIPVPLPPPSVVEEKPLPEPVAATPTRPPSTIPSAAPLSAAGSRNKACANCRKSKRKCLHDENGNLDPVKVAESKLPRTSAKKNQNSNGGESSSKKIKSEAAAGPIEGNVIHVDHSGLSPYPAAHDPYPRAPIAPMMVMTNGSHTAEPLGEVSDFREALRGLQEGMELLDHPPQDVDNYNGDVDMQDHLLPAFDNFAHPLDENQTEQPADALSPVELVGQSHPAEPLTNGFGHADVPVDPSLDAMMAEQTLPPPEEHPRSPSTISELSDLPPTSPTQIHNTIERRNGSSLDPPQSNTTALPITNGATPPPKVNGSSISKSPEASLKKTPGSNPRKRASVSSARDTRAVSGASGTSELEDESLRLARELQGMEFGLRRARGR